MKRILAAVMILNLCAVFGAAAEFNLEQVNAGSIKSMEIDDLPVPAAVQARDTAGPGKAGPSLDDAVNAMIDAEMEACLDLGEVTSEIVNGYYYEYQYTNAKKHSDVAMAEALVLVKKTGAELDNISERLRLAGQGGAGNTDDYFVGSGMFDISEIYLARCERLVAKMKASGRALPEVINVIDAELKQVRVKYDAIQPLLRELGEQNKPRRGR
ncbi:MAG: hypothetical protein PHV33_10195 [Elusimicrobiales bacterium]|nr:hypothetical protein [Elusimicrobiales bacterium]